MIKALAPEISVVMPVYNARTYVAEALQSVLDQTYGNFELLVIDDGSTDDTRAIIQRFRDSRVVVTTNQMNLGVVASLNRGLSLCRGEFIARMDADDISEPDRLARQLNFLTSHSDVDIVGGAITYFGDVKRPYDFVFPTEHEDIRAALLFYCPLAHPTLMFRSSLVRRNMLLYSDDFRHAEDYYLWSELLQHVRAANLADVLLRYRLHATQVRSEHVNPQHDASVRVRERLLSHAGVNWTDGDIELHESIISGRYGTNTLFINQVASWFDKIEQANRMTGFWDARALHRLLVSKVDEITRRLGLGYPTPSLNKLALQYLRNANFRPDQATRRLYRRIRSLMRRVFSN